MSKVLHSESLYGGVFVVLNRDTSYWNDENGPNREDSVTMAFIKNSKFYSIGSHVSIKGALKWVESRRENFEKFKESVQGYE